MEVELFTDGNWRNTKLMVDGKMEKFVTRLDIFIGDKLRTTIEVFKPVIGHVPYGSLVDIKGIRHKTDESGHVLPTSDMSGLQTESFEYKNVNVYKVD